MLQQPAYEPWQALAVCGDEQVRGGLDFFAEDRWAQRDCVTICKTLCPVRTECLTAALRNEETHGIWGGNTGRELREALALDVNHQTHDYGIAIACPSCRSEDVVVHRKRRVRISVSCSQCKFTWDRRRIIKSRTVRKPE